jgi:hypothetical protein
VGQDLPAAIQPGIPAGLRDAFVYTFIEDSPTSPEPRYDYDVASFGIVKVLPYDTIEDVDETAYWEPKQSFNALADRYGAIQMPLPPPERPNPEPGGYRTVVGDHGAFSLARCVRKSGARPSATQLTRRHPGSRKNALSPQKETPERRGK